MFVVCSLLEQNGTLRGGFCAIWGRPVAWFRIFGRGVVADREAGRGEVRASEWRVRLVIWLPGGVVRFLFAWRAGF